MPVAPSSDPRDVVTPAAFEVSPDLLGLPLATPGRRLTALLIDLAVVGILTVITRSFALVLGAVVAVLFIRLSFKRTEVRGGVFGRAMRASLGCLGVVVGLTTALIWVSMGLGGPGGDATVNVSFDDSELQLTGPGSIERALGGLVDLGALRTADTPQEAEAVATRLAAVGMLGGAEAEELESLLLANFPDDAPWSADAPEIVGAALAAAEVIEPGQLGLDGSTGDGAEPDGGGLFDTLRELLDELGFGFGWASLYFTVTLSTWGGRTVGKRVMRIRVMRLDGLPINWWVAFERAGGYAAGFATGLLGFAQVYWDANRQAIHDRIVGTVVVADGVERVPED